MSSSSHNRIDGLLYLLIGGPVSLVWGLRKLKEKRLIQNTPRSKVRSAAMGLVELQGIARTRLAKKSPVSNLDTCWWNCRVEELQSNGKSSSWVTIKEVDSRDFFYLEDSTGRVLVNPANAELHVLDNIFELNSSTRTRMSAVLIGWGLNDTNWFGLERRMRVVEQLIPECAPLFILGELMSIGNQPEDRRAKLRARLRAVKANPAKMAEADVNHDGTVDAEEWAAFEAQQEEAFVKEEMTRQVQMPNQDNLMVKAPMDSPFVVSTKEEKDLINSFSWLAPLAIFGGMGLSGLGVWLALSMNWDPLIIIGTLAAGFVLSFFGKTLNIGFIRS